MWFVLVFVLVVWLSLCVWLFLLFWLLSIVWLFWLVFLLVSCLFWCSTVYMLFVWFDVCFGSTVYTLVGLFSTVYMLLLLFQSLLVLPQDFINGGTESSWFCWWSMLRCVPLVAYTIFGCWWCVLLVGYCWQFLELSKGFRHEQSLLPLLRRCCVVRGFVLVVCV